MKAVKFLVNYAPYKKGDIAGVDEKKIDELVEKGIVSKDLGEEKKVEEPKDEALKEDVGEKAKEEKMGAENKMVVAE